MIQTIQMEQKYHKSLAHLVESQMPFSAKQLESRLALANETC